MSKTRDEVGVMKYYLAEVASFLIARGEECLCSELIDLKGQAENVFRHVDTALFNHITKRMTTAEEALAHQDRKIQHGCTDAYCPLCDGDERDG